MKLGEEWLYDLVPSLRNCVNFKKKLLQVGIETHYVPDLISPPLVSNAIVGTITNILVHPKNKNYMIYLVYLGNFFLHKTIISFLKIFHIGDKVLVAISNVTYYKNSFVTNVEIFGKISEGFFCDFYMLNRGFKKNDIVFLSKNISNGENFSKYLLKNARIIKFECPSNRIDLQCVFGLAREIAIINQLSLPQLPKKKILKNFKKYRCQIDFEDFSEHINYTFREIHNLDNKNVFLPFLIQERLRKCDLMFENVLENLVHYLFLETGHWFHIFDIDLLKKQKIKVRLSKKGECVYISSKKKIYLQENTLILSNFEQILSFSDMFEITGAKVTKNTKNLFIGTMDFLQESFFLKKKEIFFLKKICTNLKYNICSYKCLNILDYFTFLILKICGGTETTVFMKLKNFFKKNTKKILVNFKKINNILGVKILEKKIVHILKKNFFKYTFENNLVYFQPPYWRLDILIEEDIIGEIVSKFGCHKIPSLPFKQNSYNSSIQLNNVISLSRIKSFLINNGYFEIISYSFINPKFQKFFFPNQKFLVIKNPISIEMSVMRSTLWIGLLNCVAYHQNRQYEHIRIFETGLCFFLDDTKDLHVRQEDYLACAISGFVKTKSWYSTNRNFDFYDMKGIVESIFDLFGQLKKIHISPKIFHGLKSNCSAGIYISNQLIGKIGILDSLISEKFSITQPVILFEILWKKIFLKNSFIVRPISELPKIKRDISIIVKEDIMSSQIVNMCYQILKNDNVEIFLYDMYHGEKIQKGYKSLSLRFIFESFKKNLVENQISKKIQNCILGLKNEFQAILRD
ncbi:phenylalanine--tRNA ligase subunit beta [Buchnera aphidicola]|uniref:phenylalanine--tRNA ligase subunit beta n=1 Tax=Buchnera aphidicola TaxID=9 RepID=UPI00313CC8DF